MKKATRKKKLVAPKVDREQRTKSIIDFDIFCELYLARYGKKWEEIQECVTRMIQDWIQVDELKEIEKFKEIVQLSIPKKVPALMLSRTMKYLRLNYGPKILPPKE